MFGVLFPDRSFPMDLSAFSQIDTTHWILDMNTFVGDSYSSVKELCIFLLNSLSLPAGKALAVYIQSPGSPFLYCGAVTVARPSAVLSLPWPDPGADSTSPPQLTAPGAAPLSAKIGVSVEDLASLPSLDAAGDRRIERMALKVGENLFNFMQSFCGVDGSRLIVPMDILDRWFKKFQDKAKRDPDYLKGFTFLRSKNTFSSTFTKQESHCIQFSFLQSSVTSCFPVFKNNILPTQQKIELPLYLILGMLCGVVSVAFCRLVDWFTKSFELIKEKFRVPAVVCSALGGLGAGIIALKYPGILYWGFTNVDEILHTGKTASAPGIGLLAQLAADKVVGTALCKGSGLVGGLYAPSLMIGAAVVAVFGGSAAELINSAIPGNDVIAQPQAYALVGMAATLASVCSVPLTSVLLLFELTKDYRILLPLVGAVGLAIWVPSIANQGSKGESYEAKSSTKRYSIISPREAVGNTNRDNGDSNQLELSILGNASFLETTGDDVLWEDLKVCDTWSVNYVKASSTMALKEAIKIMRERRHSFILVVDDEDLLEGILTLGDIRRWLSNKSSEAPINTPTFQDVYEWPISNVCTRGISYHGQERGVLTCYPDTDLATAKDLMEAKGIKQLPVVKRGGASKNGRRRRIVAAISYDSILNHAREGVNLQDPISHHRKEENLQILVNGH